MRQRPLAQYLLTLAGVLALTIVAPELTTATAAAVADSSHSSVVSPLAGVNTTPSAETTAAAIDDRGQSIVTVPQFLERYGVHYRGPQPSATNIRDLVARPNNWVSIQFRGHRAHFQTHGSAAEAMNFRIEWAPGDFVEDHLRHSWKLAWDPSDTFQPFATYAKGSRETGWNQLPVNAANWYEPQALDLDGHTTAMRYVIYWTDPNQAPGPDLPTELLHTDWGHDLNNAPASFNSHY